MPHLVRPGLLGLLTLFVAGGAVAQTPFFGSDRVAIWTGSTGRTSAELYLASGAEGESIDANRFLLTLKEDGVALETHSGKWWGLRNAERPSAFLHPDHHYGSRYWEMSGDNIVLLSAPPQGTTPCMTGSLNFGDSVVLCLYSVSTE